MRISTFLFVVSASLFAQSAKSQITITSTSMPSASTFVVNRYLDSVSSVRVNLGTTGANQVWNFSTAGLAPVIENDTTYFMAANRTPYFQHFSNAQLATKADDEFTYYGYNANGISLLGSRSTSGDSSRYTPAQMWLRLPLAFNNTFADTTRLIVTSGTLADTLTYRQQAVADAWGSITTPAGTFNALRVRRLLSFELEIIGIPIVVNTINHEWWSNTRPTPVFSHSRTVMYTPFGNDTTFDASFMQRFTVGTDDPVATFNSVEKVFPNPAVHQITVSFDLKQSTEARFDIVNLAGQTQLSSNFETWTVGKNTKNLNLETISEGAYLLRMVNRSNETIGIYKFTVNK